MTAWATGRNETWHHLKKGFKHLSVEYAALGDKASQGVCVKFEALQQFITTYKPVLLLLLFKFKFKLPASGHECSSLSYRPVVMNVQV